MPARLTKLAIYVRISVDPYVDAMPMPLRLVFPNGEEKRANEISAELLASAQADARKTGVPRATAICRIVMQAFPVISYGQMKQSLDQTTDRLVCATPNFRNLKVSSSSERPHPYRALAAVLKRKQSGACFRGSGHRQVAIWNASIAFGEPNFNAARPNPGRRRVGGTSALIPASVSPPIVCA